MAITPMFFEQIEKFQCLKLSTAQGPAHGHLRRHVGRVTWPQTCREVSQLFCPKSPKTTLKPSLKLRTLHPFFILKLSFNIKLFKSSREYSYLFYPFMSI